MTDYFTQHEGAGVRDQRPEQSATRGARLSSQVTHMHAVYAHMRCRMTGPQDQCGTVRLYAVPRDWPAGPMWYCAPMSQDYSGYWTRCFRATQNNRPHISESCTCIFSQIFQNHVYLYYYKN